MRFLILTMIAAFLTPGFSALGDEPRIVRVGSHSEVDVSADEAVITFAIQTHERLVRDAKTKNDAATARVLDSLRNVRPEIKRIESVDFRMYRGETSYKSGVYVYNISRDYSIRTTDLQQIDLIIDTLVELGEDLVTVSGVEMIVTDQTPHQIKARELAVDYARVKASHLASLTGMKLGTARHIFEDAERNDQVIGGMGGMGASIMDEPQPLKKDFNPVRFASQSKLVEPRTKDDGEARKDEPAERLIAASTVTITANLVIEFELLPAD